MKKTRIFAGMLASLFAALSIVMPETALLETQNVYAEEEYSDVLELGAVWYKKVDSTSDGEYDYIVIAGCDENAETVEIPDKIEDLPVYGMDRLCFEKREKLKEIKLPDTLRVMSNNAFNGCSSLKSIDIPESVIKIETETFSGCDNLERIDVNENNKLFCSIDGVLYDSRKFELLHYPKGRKNTSFEIPDTVSIIKYFGVFAECSALKEIILPSTLGDIYPDSMKCCENLEKVTILNPKCYINEYPFAISNGQTADGEYYFNGTIYGYKNSTAERYATEFGYKFEAIEGTPYSSGIDAERIEDSVYTQYIKFDEDNDGTDDYIEIYNFHPSYNDECEIPAEIDGLPVRIIGFAAAQGRLIDGVKIADTVKEFRENAFSQCFYLKNITLPESVEIIGRRAFFTCTNLKDVTIKNPKCVIYDEKRTISNGLSDDYFFDGTIHGYTGSTAQAYAEKYGYKFEAIEGDTPDVPDPVVTTAPAVTTAVSTESTALSAAVSTTVSVTEAVSSDTAETESTTVIPVSTATETTSEATTTAPSTDTPNPVTTERKKGDVTGNGKIDIQDVILIAKAIGGIKQLSPEAREAADVNSDGKFNILDVIAAAKLMISKVPKS